MDTKLILLFILSLTDLALGIYATILYSKYRDLKDEELSMDKAKQLIDEMVIHNKVHPLVSRIYSLFVSKNGAEKFRQRNYTIEIPSLGIEIWKENSEYSRSFHALSEDIKKEYNSTKDEINNSLSYWDHKILDIICKRVEVNNKEFIERLFI